MDELRKIADAATPGPWALEQGRRLLSTHPAIASRSDGSGLMYPDGSGWCHDGDLEFIATFDPEMVGALLAIAYEVRGIVEAGQLPEAEAAILADLLAALTESERP